MQSPLQAQSVPALHINDCNHGSFCTIHNLNQNHGKSHSLNHGISGSSVHPFGFMLFNQRNHAHLRWLSAETEHFIISYPEHLAGIENEAAAIAEETYRALSQNFNVEFDYKIRINLSDEDEIVNGFAVPLNRAYTNIWVNMNDVANSWSGEEKWLRTVIAHELAHIFHFEAVKGNIPFTGLLNIVPSLSVPWIEGIAQYQTEPWHFLRGDQLLRTAFYDGRPSYSSGESLLDGQLMYASGNAQLRYFSSTYGDSLFPKILAHRDSRLFGLIKMHNFRNAFKEVVDKPFSDFEDEWRRHTSIYYHTLAGQMERSDSLGVRADTLHGMFILHDSFSPNMEHRAVISFHSEERPIPELNIYERFNSDDELHTQTEMLENRRTLVRGNLRGPISWHPGGERLLYAETSRGDNGSLINDIYELDIISGRRSRITRSRRASSANYDATGAGFYFVGSASNTANIFYYDFETGSENQLTFFEGDVQIGGLAVSPDGRHIAFAVFDADGSRPIRLLNPENGEIRTLIRNQYDNRRPIWSPDGSQLAYTSVRENVPNVFVIDLNDYFANQGDADWDDFIQESRFTALFTGAQALQWTKSDPNLDSDTERITLQTTDSKRNTRVYRVDAERRAPNPEPIVNPAYTKWLTHQPPVVIPAQIQPNADLITRRYKYNSWNQISHLTTLPFPYYANERNFGVGFLTAWTEPLSRHSITALGGISFVEPANNSLILLSYINNQLAPTISLNLYNNSFTGRIYEQDFLVTNNSGGFLLASIPRDWIDSPFVQSTLYGRLRIEYTDATTNWSFPNQPQLPEPQNGWQNDLRVGLRITRSVPYAHNIIHPLEGWGFESRITYASDALFGETNYVRPDLIGYSILPGPGDSRFYLYGRAVAQWGDSFAQDYIGLSRFDDVRFGDLVPGVEILYADTERVRGFNDYVPGERLLFGTLEYRIPFLPDLETTILGVVSLGRTTISAFTDAAIVWNDSLLPTDDANRISRAGAGFELKNTLQVGLLGIVHSLGFAQPIQSFGTERDQEIYYRVQAVIPF
ncbi:MAG: hypothetical protein LAT67_08415 [Balneolales bacterium]|nr:hypothetical protein [Balneolales bacterium]